MNEAVLFIFCLVGFIATAYAIFKSQSPAQQWQETRKFITVETISRWSQIRSNSWCPSDAREAQIKGMTEQEFEDCVIWNLKEVGLQDEADYFISRSRHRRQSEQFSTTKSSPLAAWDVEYKH